MEMHASDEFTVAFEYASAKTGERFQNPLWFITEIFFGRRFRSSVARVKEFGSVIVNNAVASRESKVSEARQTSSDNALESISGSLISSLLDAISDRQVVADAALNYLSAGTCRLAPIAPSIVAYAMSRERYHCRGSDVGILSHYAASTRCSINSKRRRDCSRSIPEQWKQSVRVRAIYFSIYHCCLL